MDPAGQTDDRRMDSEIYPDAGVTNRRDAPDHPLWIAALHIAACRRWLESEPPELREVDASLRSLEALSSRGASPMT